MVATLVATGSVEGYRAASILSAASFRSAGTTCVSVFTRDGNLAVTEQLHHNPRVNPLG